MDKEEKQMFFGGIIVIIGFILYGVTSTIYMKPPFDYYSKPSVWFIISIITMITGFVLGIIGLKSKIR